MSRTTDLLLPDTTYHIYNRGNNKENLFKEERNCSYFMNLLIRHINPIADIFACALLPNHFHLLVKTYSQPEGKPAGYFSQSFSNFFNAYTKAMNKSYNRTGSLFQERFRRKEITNDSYFTEVIFYIHGNVQKHGIISDFRDYHYSSYSEYAGKLYQYVNHQVVNDWFGGHSGFMRYHEKYRESLIEKKIFLEQDNDE